MTGARIDVVGVGAVSGPSAAGRRALAEAEVLVGGTRLLDRFADHPAERWDLTGRLRELPGFLASRAHRRVAVLASGDPLFYGIGGWLARRLADADLRFHPAPTSVAEAAARLGLPWQDLETLSAHGRAMPDVVGALDRRGRVAVLTDPTNTPAAVGRLLRAAGRVAGRAHVAEALGTPDERVRTVPLANLADLDADPLTVLILEAEGPRAPAIPHIPDAEFDQKKPIRGLITKREVRVLALARLGLRPGDTCWDIGARAGAVSVEMARLGAAAVHAVEKNEDGCAIVEANALRFGTPQVRVVHARAPEGLDALPDPDRVFVGGSAGGMAAILAAAWSRLRPGGGLVVNVATVENLHAALAALREIGAAFEVVQVQVSRGRTILGRLTRFEALNPVWIVSAGKPAGGAA